MKKNKGHEEGHQIVKSGFSSVLQIIVASIGYVVIYALVILNLGKELLGVWSIVTAIPAVVAFLGSGVSGSLVRYIPIYVEKKEAKPIQKIIYNGLLFNLALGFLLVTMAKIFAVDILKFMFGLPTIPKLYLQLFDCALFTFLINFLSSVFLSALEGLQQIVKKNKIIIYCTITFCIAASFLILRFGIVGLLYAQIIQSILILISSLWVLQRMQSFSLKLNKIDRDFMRIFYRYGGKLQYVSILNILFEPVTKYFLNKYFNLGIVGTYDLVNRIVSQIRMLIVNAIQAIVPFVAGKNETNGEISTIYAKSFRGALLLSSILYGGLISAGFSWTYLFHQLDPTEFQFILVYLTIGYFVNILSAPAYSIRLALGKLSYLIIAQLLSTGLNILLFVLLKQFLSVSVILLPTCLAIGISAIYVIISYKPTFNKALKVFQKEDYAIYLISILFPVLCIVVSLCYFNLLVVLLISSLHGIVMLFLVFRNPYLMNVIHILVKKEHQTLHG